MKKILAIIGLAAVTLAGGQAQILVNYNSATTLDFNNLNTNFGGTYNATGGSSPFTSGTATVTTPYAIYSGSTNPALVITAFNDFDPGGVYSNTSTYDSATSWRALQDANTTDLSLGMKNSGTGRFVLRLKNSTAQALDSWSISYNVEQYSQGASPSTITFDYGLSSPTGTFITTGLTGGSAVTATTGTAGNLATVLSTSRTATIATSIAADGEIYLRWTYNHVSGTSPHLGVDDIVFTAVPEPKTWLLIGIGSAFMLWNLRRRRDLVG
ncbi:MAG: PEP-CTERM sorting domain-containing protein [Terrimicrobiaceae bacterium]